MSKLLGSFLMTGLVFAACGGGGGGSLSVTDAIEEEAAVVCSQAYTCMAQYPAGAPIAFEQLFGTSEAMCVTQLSSEAAEIQASVDAGRIEFNSSASSTCTDFIDGLSCADLWSSFFQNTPPAPAACDQAFVGKVADGGTCTTSLDCANADSFCDDTTMTCG